MDIPRLKIFSRIIHIVFIASFFLPFLKGCDTVSAEEKAKIEKALQDSIASAKAEKHVVVADSVKSIITVAAAVTDRALKKQEPFSEKATKAVLFSEGNYTGLGLAIITFNEISVCLILVVTSFVLGFYKRGRVFRFIFMCSLAEILCLLIALCASDRESLMYGFWVSIAVCLLNAFVSGIIFRKEAAPKT